MLVVDNLSQAYGSHLVLKNISFKLKRGHALGIMGESGSGKSTLARFLIGLEKAGRGDISWNGVYYSKMNKEELRQRHREMQIVFQDAFSAVNARFTVEDVLYEPLHIFYGKKIKADEKREKALKVLDYVELSGVDLKKKAHFLSGGQLQRLCLARALIVEPQLLILDESLSGLDPLIQLEILNLLARLKKELNLTYIFIAHDFLSCYYLCDQIIILDQGEIIEYIDDLDKELELKHEKSKKIISVLEEMNVS